MKRYLVVIIVLVLLTLICSCASKSPDLTYAPKISLHAEDFNSLMLQAVKADFDKETINFIKNDIFIPDIPEYEMYNYVIFEFVTERDTDKEAFSYCDFSIEGHSKDCPNPWGPHDENCSRITFSINYDEKNKIYSHEKIVNEGYRAVNTNENKKMYIMYNERTGGVSARWSVSENAVALLTIDKNAVEKYFNKEVVDLKTLAKKADISKYTFKE